MTRMKTWKTEIAQASKIYNIIAPWLEISDEREHCQVILASGRKITILCPLGAAVEIEEAGHKITVH